MGEQKREKILLLSGALGEGHNQAAKAILEASEMYRPDIEVEIVDFMEWTHPHLHSIGKFCYIQCVRNFPSVYGYLFQKTRADNSFSNFFKRLKSFSPERMLKLLKEVRPTVVVSTFPPAAAAMSLMKSRRLTNVPTVTVITDHTDHSYWLHPHTDRYIVGSDHVRRALLRHQIPDTRISVTGIPVRLSYSQSFDSIGLRKQYGLDTSLPTVLVMGGGLGLIGKELVSLLKSDAIPEPVQFVIVCGHNIKLMELLTEELKHVRHRVLITGYVNHVHEFMALSDLILTKPGGLTTSEALALELPMLLYKPLPGQEQDNAAYLVDIGVAMEAKNDGELRSRLVHLIQNREVLAGMKAKARKCTRKEAALDALQAILKTKDRHHPAWQNPRGSMYVNA